MKKIIIVLMLFGFFLIPSLVFANNNDDETYKLLSQTTKYYKTITYEDSSSKSITYEITKKEFDSVDINDLKSNPTTYETTYKSMTTSILSSGNYYRYKNVLTWKNIPSTRSYDIIGIGFNQTVKVRSNSMYFDQYYCVSGGSCSTIYEHYPQTFISGAGASFQLPSGSLNTLVQTFYFDVEKNTNNTIYSQTAYGDYSHATSTISLNNSKKYSVIHSSGIVLDSSISSYYDSIPTATAIWTGSW